MGFESSLLVYSGSLLKLNHVHLSNIMSQWLFLDVKIKYWWKCLSLELKHYKWQNMSCITFVSFVSFELDPQTSMASKARYMQCYGQRSNDWSPWRSHEGQNLNSLNTEAFCKCYLDIFSSHCPNTAGKCWRTKGQILTNFLTPMQLQCIWGGSHDCGVSPPQKAAYSPLAQQHQRWKVW